MVSSERLYYQATDAGIMQKIDEPKMKIELATYALRVRCYSSKLFGPSRRLIHQPEREP